MVKEAGVSFPIPSAESGEGDHPSSWSGLQQAMLQFRGRLNNNARVARRVLHQLDASRRSAVAPNDADAGVADDDQRMLRALVRLYRDPGMFYLNLYGPPGTIRTVPYHEALDARTTAERDVSGKVVFVGAGFSTIANVDQIDTYSTVYGDLSGVEIQATAFANLLTGDVLRPVSGLTSVGLLLVFAA